MIISLRKATKNDADLTFNIEESSIKEYSDLVYETTLKQHRQKFDVEFIQIIELDKNAIGYLELIEFNYCIEIVNILIQKKFQNNGFGKELLQKIIKDSKSKAKSIELQVLKNNPKAKKFYENSGFQVYFETEFEFKMKFSHANR